MRLADYLLDEKLTMTAFAKLIGAEPMTVHRYVKAGRVPRPKIMRRIITVTGGKVRADDFFALAPKRASRRPGL